ncbi:uncharacterized protein LOC119694160 [Plutella xylostella]|uniref:uncharacterized protein LOC119694160 n=1 Tax=Plutella xylostella TaxID=51655 RepID=UPI0020328D4C|nr:uncharacterized protein LOC119694160 [Plutella xylostella]
MNESIMEEEVEDMVGDVTYTDSQKSVALDMYSYEQSESVSTDKNTNSGRETYVLEIDDSDESDSLQAEPMCAEPAATLNHPHFMKTKQMVEKVSTNNRDNNGSKIVQEIFTQTSKTIIQIAQAEGYAKATRVSTLETQTSYVFLADNKGVENRTQCEVTNRNKDTGDTNNYQTKNPDGVICNYFNSSLDDESSKFAVTESENERTFYFSDITSSDVNKTSDADNSVPPLSITEVEDEDSLSYEYEESLKSEAEFEQDSLKDPKRLNTIKDDCSDASEVSIDQDVEELYSKLTENNGLPLEDPDAIDKRMNIFVNTTLAPLTEEDPEQKRSSIIDITPQATHIQPVPSTKNDVLFTNSFGMKVKVLPEEKLPSAVESVPFKLPPIQKHLSCPNSPHLNQLFTMKAINRPVDTDTLPSIYQAPNPKLDRWNAATKHNPASGENAQISERGDLSRSADDSNHLPPINLDLRAPFHLQPPYSSRSNKSSVSANVPQTISIKKQIRELKQSPNRVPIWRTSLCRNFIPNMIHVFRTETLEGLEDLPNVLDKYWTTISDSRIADLIRQICSLVESPRTQVARTACTTLSVLLQNTKYTKKPDFYEAISILLVKTGSFCRPVRRAANVALDRVACAADLAHTVTAICAHGIDHKNPLVRCAAARLLVVSVALSAGRGRELLRCRPALAATARRHALQALARLLEDKNQETRKYAERLYGMLRPLANFEAFYLTDVTLETAAAQMKKHDRLLTARAGHESR